MTNKKLQGLLNEMKQLSPGEKGQLFSLFLMQEKNEMNGERKSLYGSVKVSNDIEDEVIESGLYNPKTNDFLED